MLGVRYILIIFHLYCTHFPDMSLLEKKEEERNKIGLLWCQVTGVSGVVVMVMVAGRRRDGGVRDARS